MIAPDSYLAASDAAGSTANAGHGMLHRCTGDAPPFSYRLAQRQGLIEHDVINGACARLASEGLRVSRRSVADYYVSLKTNPFVVLIGEAKAEKSTFVRAFAETLVGSGSAQYIQVTGGASWPDGTGKGAYYQTIVERFDSLRLLDMLYEAAAPGNCGKAYMLCLDGMHPHELNHYFTRLLRLTPEGERRLALPGLEPKQQPVVPANLYITAVVNIGAQEYQFDNEVLSHAGLIDVPCVDEQAQNINGRSSLSQWLHGLTDRHNKAYHEVLPPVGYQRVMIDSAIHDVDTARCKLAAILGNTVTLLRPSFELSRLLWREGITLNTSVLRELTRYVANSFDKHGNGLIDPADALNNAQLALDIQVTQRLVWQLPYTCDKQLRNDLLTYGRSLCSSSATDGTEYAVSQQNTP